MSRQFFMAAVAAGCVGQASATWSILIVDTRTGEMGVASATCLIGIDLLQLTPVLIEGVGGVTAQSFGDSTGVNRTFIRDRLLQGVSPPDILPLLAAFDPGHQTRQYGMIDATGGVATFTGTGAGAWAGGVTGQTGTLIYAVQGNVLTGAPVVLAAEQAIIATPGDLPEKLMAAMEAARSMGGDGRCSCSPSSPENCGAPPPEPFKSADVGYMLVSRAGDFSAANGTYGIGGAPTSIIATDFDFDGKPDIIASRTSGGIITLLRNVTPEGSAFSMLENAGTLVGPANPVALALLDVTSDGLNDLVAFTSSGSSVRVFAAQPGGGFAFDADVPTGITGLGFDARAGLGGVMVLTSTTLGLLDPTNGLAFAGSIEVGPNARRAAPDPLDSNQAFVVNTAGQVHRVRRDGNALSIAQTLSLGTDLVAIIAGDVNADGRTDLLVASDSGRQADLLLDDGIGDYSRQTFVTGQTGRDVMMADFDGDGDIDPAVLANGFAVLFILRNESNTTYTQEAPAYITRIVQRSVAVDLNADGLPEVVSGGSQANGVVIGDNLGGRFAANLGTAAGEYFLALNIAGARRTDPDPVFQLQNQFDLWRADLLGRPDAVQSSASIDIFGIPAGSSRDVALTIRLKDWTTADITSPVAIDVAHASGSSAQSTIGPVESLGGGAYRVLLSGAPNPGRDIFRITVDDGIRPVVLMPSPSLRIIDARSDFDGDGEVSFFDALAFVGAFSAGDLRADLDGNQSLDQADVLLFFEFMND